jgi:hypothetical protein
MTAADLPAPHPDLDTLADLDAGALDAAAAAEVAAHVSGCARCTRASAALGTVRVQLHAQPRPEMPAVVAARLDATLAALRGGQWPGQDAGPAGVHRTDAPSTGPEPTRGTLTGADLTSPDPASPDPTSPDPASAHPATADPAGPDRSSASPTSAGPTSAGPTTASSTGADPTTARSTTARSTSADPAGPDRSSASPTSSDPARTGSGGRPAGRQRGGTGSPSRAPSDPADLAAARLRRRRRLSRGVGAAAAAVALLAAGASLNELVSGGIGGTDDAAPASAQQESLGRGDAGSAGSPASPDALPSYSRESLRAALAAIERASPVGVTTAGSEAGQAGVMADAGRRTACVGTIPGSRGELRAVLRISYEGRPAYVFVFSDAGRRTGYVVTEQCGTSTALPAPVLDTVS